MSSTANLNIPYLKAAQSQKHVTVNQSLQILDTVVQLSFFSRNLQTPPLNPTNGDRYIVPDGSIGEWSSHFREIASWQDNAWIYSSPKTGWRGWVEDENLMVFWDGSDWSLLPISVSEIQNLETLGVNSLASDTHRLYVKSDNLTFASDTGSVRQFLNKNVASDTASLIFQSASSGRLEIGLTGTDDLQVNVSDDGVNWGAALTINHTNAECQFSSPISLPQYSKASLPATSPASRLIYVGDATGGAAVAFCDGSNWKRISDNSVIN